MKIRLQLVDYFGEQTILTEKSYDHILDHPEMEKQEERLKETIQSPEIVKYSKHDRRKLLYYRFYEKTPVTQKYLVVIVKKHVEENFIVTSFYTDKIKAGETLWKK